MGVGEFGILLFVASLVSIVCRRFRIPYTVGLTFAGLFIGFLPKLPTFTLTKDLIFSALLPPLVFEAALQIRWPVLRRDLLITVTLATLGVLLSVGVVTLGISVILGWPLMSALVVAVLMSATDPVSVIAVFKSTKVSERLKLLVEAESLLNDGTAAVLFSLVIAAVGGGSFSGIQVVGNFAYVVVGGIAWGAAVALLGVGLAGKAHDHLVEITLSLLSAYASFLLAERFHCSGVLASLTAGLIMGNSAVFVREADHGRDPLESFWEVVAFVANSLIFLLIGLQLAERPLGAVILPIGVLILLTLIGRGAAVYGTCALFVRSRFRVELNEQHLLVWGGLRGALALALALALPAHLAYRQEIVDLTFGVVAFSTIVQGMTVQPVLRWLKLVDQGTAS